MENAESLELVEVLEEIVGGVEMDGEDLGATSFAADPEVSKKNGLDTTGRTISFDLVTNHLAM